MRKYIIRFIHMYIHIDICKHDMHKNTHTHTHTYI